jgi:hypothetical protein
VPKRAWHNGSLRQFTELARAIRPAFGRAHDVHRSQLCHCGRGRRPRSGLRRGLRPLLPRPGWLWPGCSRRQRKRRARWLGEVSAGYASRTEHVRRHRITAGSQPYDAVCLTVVSEGDLNPHVCDLEETYWALTARRQIPRSRLDHLCPEIDTNQYPTAIWPGRDHCTAVVIP